MRIDEDLKAIMDHYISDYLIKKNEIGEIICGDFPIIWFGNLKKYLSSNKKKIVTVAVNPSKDEFGEKRFDNINLNNYNESSEEDKSRLLSDLADTLNEYFEESNGKKAYWKWFKPYNSVLKHIGADYKNHDSNGYAVVHVDIYSAIATDPTWLKLSKAQKDTLANTDLFVELIRYLRPDIVLYSTDKDVFPNLIECLNSVFGNEEKIVFNKEYYIKENRIIGKIGDKIEEERFIGINDNEHSLHSQNYLRIYSNAKKTRTVIWGKNISLPFTVFDDNVRRTILKAWLEDGEIKNDLSYVRIKKEQ